MNVCVVMGGPSAEYEISIRSGAEALRHLLDSGRHRLRAVVVDHQRRFYYRDVTEQSLTADECAEPRHGRFAGPFAPVNSEEVWRDCDVAFLALHGEFGEDGCIQGFLQTAGVPFTGSPLLASATAMNKITAKRILAHAGLDTPDYTVYSVRDKAPALDDIEQRHGFPCFVKCPQSGSSRLMGRADSRASLEQLVAELSPSANQLLIESGVDGVELSCPVLERPGGELVALPPVEIRPNDSTFFDFRAKYTDGACRELVPAEQPPELLEEVRAKSLLAHRVLECSGVSRTDFIAADGRLYVLEVNTLPGITTNSLLPKSFAAAGGTYTELLETLLHTARGALDSGRA